MEPTYGYFDLNNLPCRIELLADGKWGEAEIYSPGEGFVPGPEMEILYDSIALSREEFNALVMEQIEAAKRRK